MYIHSRQIVDNTIPVDQVCRHIPKFLYLQFLCISASIFIACHKQKAPDIYSEEINTHIRPHIRTLNSHSFIHSSTENPN